ncbi:MAG: hypothetical protein ACPLX7_08675 [Candidatus Kapaibacteriota bacterium]
MRLTLTPHGCCANAARESSKNALQRAQLLSKPEIEHIAIPPIIVKQ